MVRIVQNRTLVLLLQKGPEIRDEIRDRVRRQVEAEGSPSRRPHFVYSSLAGAVANDPNYAGVRCGAIQRDAPKACWISCEKLSLALYLAQAAFAVRPSA